MRKGSGRPYAKEEVNKFWGLIRIVNPGSELGFLIQDYFFYFSKLKYNKPKAFYDIWSGVGCGLNLIGAL